MIFMGEKGYPVIDSTLYQDNQSTIRMLTNGRNSCEGISRHIYIRYFFLKYQIDNGEIRVEYRPSYVILADFFTKPLQGELFKKLRDVIMRYQPISGLK